MMTVTEIAKQTGISVRTLHHYDAIGLLKPTQVTEAGYRLYDTDALEKLYLILLFREIGFPLKQIRKILDAPDYDRNRVLEQQIALMERKQQRLEYMINMARGIKLIGVRDLSFEGFDFKKIDDYAEQAKTLYGKTEAYKEYTQKASSRTKAENQAVNGQVMDFFVRLGAMKDQAPDSEGVQAWVAELQAFFTQHFYNCTPQILMGLGESYGGGGTMNENIDAAGGAGTGAFAREAIGIFCKK